jgi:hypothetical protein
LLANLGLGHGLAYALQLCLGIVFAMAAVPKIRHPARAVRTVAHYQLAPGRMAPALTAVLVATESFLAVAFLSGWRGGIVLPLAMVTFVAFTVAVTINLRRGRRIACGCFSDGRERISARSLVRLSIFLAAVISLSVLPEPGVTVASLAKSGSEALEFLLRVGGMAGFLWLTVTWLLNLPEAALPLKNLRQSASH